MSLWLPALYVLPQFGLVLKAEKQDNFGLPAGEAPAAPTRKNVRVSHLKTNHITNPLGFAFDQPTFAWIVEETADTVQTAAHVRVAYDAEFQQIVFDSGKV